MNTLWIVVIATVVIYLAYNFYARRIDRDVIQVRREEGDAGHDVHGWRGLHAHEQERPVRLPLQVDRRGGSDRRPHHGREPLGLVPVPPVARHRGQLHRMGQRLLRDHGLGEERREQPERDLAQAHRPAHADDPLHLHLLLPDAPRRSVRRNPRGDPLRPPRRAVRHHHAGAHGPSGGPDDVPLEDEPDPRHGDRRGRDARRHGARARGARRRTRRERSCRGRSARRSSR